MKLTFFFNLPESSFEYISEQMCALQSRYTGQQILEIQMSHVLKSPCFNWFRGYSRLKPKQYILKTNKYFIFLCIMNGVPEPESLIKRVGASPGLLSETLSVTEQKPEEEEKMSFLSVRNQQAGRGMRAMTRRAVYTENMLKDYHILACSLPSITK